MRVRRTLAVFFLLGLSLAVVGAPAHAGKRQRVAKAPRAAAAAVVLPTPPPGVSPLDPTTPYVPLTGEQNALDITSMQRSQLHFNLGVDNTWLDEVDADAAVAVRTTFEADPRWKVTEEHGLVVAIRRVDREGWTVPRHGTHVDGDAAWRLVVRFSPWPSHAPWASSGAVSKAPSTAGVIPLSAWVPEGPGWMGKRATAFTVDGTHLGFDVVEAAPNKARPATVAAIETVASSVQRVLFSSAAILSMGVEAMPLPPGEPGTGTGVLVTRMAPGVLDVRGRVNPGISGWSWVRLVTSDGAWEELAVGAGTRERIGWSTDPQQTFYFQSSFPVPSGPALQATAEVWVQPDDGGPVRRVASVPVAVPER